MYDARFVEKFHASYEAEPNTGCWLWTRARITSGYGEMYWRGKNVYAHRVSYTIHKGPIPEGLYVCHHCDTPSCVNPQHLYVGTNQQNIRDASARGLLAKTHRIGTHCKHGHEFTAENTRIQFTDYGRGQKRRCVACQRERDRVRVRIH